MITFLLTIFIILIFTILFIVTGNLIRQRLLHGIDQTFHQTFNLGVSFFIGTIAFLSLWILTGHLLDNVKIALALSTSLFIIGSALAIFKKDSYCYSPTIIISSSLFTILLVIISIFKALAPMPEYFITQPELVNPFLGFGSIAHSFRAGNISEYVVSSNSLPTIGQHSGQSIIASIPLFFGQHSPQLSLTIWVGVFISFLIIITYGLARYFINHKYLALIPVLIVALGNSVLSPFYSSITDTESALLLTSNIDSIIGIATFLILSILVYFSLANNISKLLLLTIFLTGLVWNITSGQMIVLFVLLTIFWGITLRQKTHLLSLVKVLLVFIIGATLGASFLGGMLSLSAPDNQTSIPGVMSLKQPATPAIALRFPRTGESAPQTMSKIKQIYTTKETKHQATISTTEQIQTKETTSSLKQNDLLFAVAKIVRSIQLVFFPLLGLILMYIIIRRKLYFSPAHFTVIKQFWWGSVLLFSTGWIASTFFTVYGYYWELSKFFYLGVYFSLLILGISLVVFLSQYTKYRYLLAALIIFIVIGPTLELFVVRLLGNVHLPDSTYSNFQTEQINVNLKPLSLSERFYFLITSGVMYGEKHNLPINKI